MYRFGEINSNHILFLFIQLSHYVEAIQTINYSKIKLSTYFIIYNARNGISSNHQGIQNIHW